MRKVIAYVERFTYPSLRSHKIKLVWKEKDGSYTALDVGTDGYEAWLEEDSFTTLDEAITYLRMSKESTDD
jgi:hypothetical protein